MKVIFIDDWGEWLEEQHGQETGFKDGMRLYLQDDAAYF
jgi:hypothetical protein